MGGSSSRTNEFSWKSTADDTARNVDLKGKTAIVTGANTGIGFETARVLVKHGCNVVIGCRDMTRAEEAVKSITALHPGSGQMEAYRLDLSSFESVREFANHFREHHEDLHILVNNAGVMACPLIRAEGGHEMQFATNHLGHFLLTHLLIDRLERGSPARVVVVSSAAHRFGDINWDDVKWEKSYSRVGAYAQSKTANILFAMELNRRYQERGIYANSLHPGVINTEIGRHFVLGTKGYVLEWMGLMKSACQGAATSVYAATAEELERVGGLYLVDSTESKCNPYAVDPAAAVRLWEMSEKFVGI